MTTSNEVIFHRPELAAVLTRRVLKDYGQGLLPGEYPLRFGIFLTGLRGIGKSTFIAYDLVPALQDAGALVIFVALADDRVESPTEALLEGIRKALKLLKAGAISGPKSPLKIFESVELSIAGVELSFNVDKVGVQGGVRLYDAFEEVVEKAQTDVVLIVDEVQALSRSPAGRSVLWQLKIARETINNRPKRTGKFIFVGAGSHPGMIHDMVTDRDAAFFDAKELPYPVLGSDYVKFALKTCQEHGWTRLPTVGVVVQAFKTMGNRPIQLSEALEEWYSKSASATSEKSLLAIAENRAIRMARLDLGTVRQMGPLARAIFTRLASDEEDQRNPISDEAIDEYYRALGREVTIDDSLPIVYAFVAANLIVHDKNDFYHVTNPLARRIWRELQEART